MYPPPQHPSQSYAAPANAALACIVLTCGLAFIPLIGFLAWIIAVPMLIAAFVLSIITMSRGGTMAGIVLLMFSVCAPVVITFAPLIGTALGLGALGAATAATTHSPPTPELYSPRKEGAPIEPVAARRVVATPAPKAFATTLEAQQEAMRVYPQLRVAGSPMNRRFLDMTREYKKTRPLLFQEVEWPLVLAREVDSQLRSEGIVP